MRPSQNCRECGNSFSAQRATSEFCSTNCRTQFHNRRALRGAQLYDLIMTMRYDRAAGAWSMLCRMAASFKIEDDRERPGRRSWDKVAKVRDRNAHLSAATVGINIVGVKFREFGEA
jgi:hypothetical protein